MVTPLPTHHTQYDGKEVLQRFRDMAFSVSDCSSAKSGGALGVVERKKYHKVCEFLV